MKIPKDWRELFLPAHAYKSEESLRLHRFFVASCYVTSVFATSYFLMSIYMHGPLFAKAMAVSFVLFIFLPLVLRMGVRLSILANAFLAIICVIAILLIYWEGGIRRANVAPWLIVLPAFAIMLQGTRLAMTWMVIALITIAGFSYFTFQGIGFQVMFDTTKDPVFNLLSMSGLVCLITFVFYISETERKKAHDSLESQNIILDKLSKEKSKFLQIAAHDLRNPLIVIQGLADRSSDADITDEERAECLTYIVSSTNRMSELIKNLLEIQVIDAGKMAIEPQLLSMTNLLNLYLAQMAHVAAVKQTVIEVNMPETEVSIYSDPARIEQIMDNYVSNAIKYSPVGSKVRIQLKENIDSVELRVKDEGPGIDKSEMHKLFQQFSTASSIPRPGEHATGLGLAIVKKIADALDAEVGVTSEKGQGCTFYVRFPKELRNQSQILS